MHRWKVRRTPMRSRIWLPIGVLVVATAVFGLPATALAQTVTTHTTTTQATTAAGKAKKSPALPKTAKPSVAKSCGTAKPGYATCFALRRTDIPAQKNLAPNLVPDGNGPADLHSAYGLPSDGGAGQTVAIVDAFDDPTAEADLAVYRAQLGLHECTTANGCYRKVDQRGGTNYPPANQNCAGEISLDLDMVSATAPAAHMLLIEADDDAIANLAAGVDQAVAMGAKYVSNSYGSAYTSAPGSGEDA